jgi:O-antigen ligase
LEQAQRAILLGVTFLFPLVILPGITLDEFKLPKMALLLLGVSAAGGLKVVTWGLGGRALRWRPLALPIAAIMVPLTISWLASPYKQWALWGMHLRYQGLIPYALFALYGLLMADAFSGRVRALAWALAGAGAVAGLYALIQGFHLDPFFPTSPSRSIAAAAMTVGNPNFAGGFQAMVLPVCLGLFFSERGRQREAAAALSILSGIGLLFSFSQGAWLAFAVAIWTSCALLLFARRRSLALLCAGIAVALAAVGPLAVASTLVSDAATDRLGQTIEIRGQGWRAALGAVKENPLVGKGPNTLALEAARHIPMENASLIDNDQLLDDPHAIPISFLGSSGIFGALGWVIAIVLILLMAVRTSAGRSPLVIGIAAGLSAYAAQALVSIDDPTVRLTLWALAGGAAASGLSAGTVMPGEPAKRMSQTPMVAAGLILLAAGAFFASQIFLADVQARTGEEAALDNDPVASARSFERAVAARGDAAYRALAAGRLGELAIRHEDRDLFALMREHYDAVRYLNEPRWMAREALLLESWGVKVDQHMHEQAIDLALRAHELYPASVDVAIVAADMLMRAERSDEAAELLGIYLPYEPLYARYWGAWALVNARLGHDDIAAEATARALGMDARDVRALEARELLQND